jgi:hypothetical protein
MTVRPWGKAMPCEMKPMNLRFLPSVDAFQCSMCFERFHDKHVIVSADRSRSHLRLCKGCIAALHIGIAAPTKP